MINEKLKTFLLERGKKSPLKFKVLVDFLEESKYEFIGGELLGAYGLATINKAYFNIPELDKVDNQLIYFVILHEYCHVLRIERVGKDGMIKALSVSDFKDYYEHILEEEILADRFGSFFYFHLNKKLYPKYRTQQLYREEIRNEFIDKMESLHGLITDEKSYDEVMSTYIIEEWVDMEIEKPIWYRNVEIMLDGEVMQHWHLLEDVDTTYFGSLETDRIIFEDEVSHWRPLKHKNKEDIKIDKESNQENEAPWDNDRIINKIKRHLKYITKTS